MARPWVAGSGLVLALVWLSLAPLSVVEGFAPLLAFVIMSAGASVTVGRAGMVDLSLAAVAGLGAYAGGVGVALGSAPPWLSLPVGGLAGAVAGAFVGAVLGRVGRSSGALASLAVGVATVAVIERWPAGGGAAGFHAVGFVTGSPRWDLAVLLAAVLLALLAAHRFLSTRWSAGATVAAASPATVAALGGSPAVAGASAGAVAGCLVGLGGAGLAVASGSVNPAAFGLPLAAVLALAGLVGGAPPWGPPIAVLVLWAPAALWTAVPGEASGLLVGGVLGVAVLATRRGAPLRSWSPHVPPVGERHAATPRRGGRARLTVQDAQLPGGRTVSFTIEPGEIVALVGPNGSGKSTLLARIAGQLPDGGSVSMRGRSAPRGPRRRARAGVARTWQRPTGAPETAAEELAVRDDEDRAAHAAARAIVGASGASDLLQLAARRPAVALLDEPGSVHPPVVVRAFLRHLARLGTAVLVAEHRPDTVALADRVIDLGGGP